MVRWDALEGLVSLERSRQVYGVVIDAAIMAVDEAETRCMRRSRVEG